MPYIKQDKRDKIVGEMGWDEYDPDFDYINTEAIDCAGDMQYAMAAMIKRYIAKYGLSYQVCNDVMGALVGAQQEFYRRTVAPYEDKKIKENGDI